MRHVPFFHLKKLPDYFYSITDFSVNHLKVDLTFSRGNSNAVWLPTFTPVEMDMKLGMYQSDEGTPS